MDIRYLVTGTVQVADQRSGKTESFFINEIVRAESEVAAMALIARDLMRGRNCRSFVWQQLSVKRVKGEKAFAGGAGGERPHWQLSE